jgi:superfamily II DNA or RNA helicase
MNQENTIHTDKKYLSEIMNELPSNVILNKGITGCGGTWVELHSPRNSLILVPTKELVKNKLQPEYLGVYGRVRNSEVIKYLTSDKIKYKKIIGTYDCLKRLLHICPQITEYFLLVDEFHILFNSYSFRRDPILEILNYFVSFNNVCFMTATPLDENIILDELKDVPQINIKWKNEVSVKMNIINTVYVVKQLYKVLMEESTCNYHVFLNSVKTIKRL